MPRYVDADALLKHEIEADRMGAMLVVGKGHILEAPEIDAVPVVRCKDCAHGRYDEDSEMYDCGYLGLGIYNEPNHYCSYGERKEN